MVYIALRNLGDEKASVHSFDPKLISPGHQIN